MISRPENYSHFYVDFSEYVLYLFSCINPQEKPV
jgi:hypothetical protein